ncbi:proteasome-type protease [Amaricoccus tamworthensis]|uniref:proteasome-type protease n=1 Tax=Amaricoccus tamworthensis TaxID=57002 RepID=UPI003C7EC1C6
MTYCVGLLLNAGVVMLSDTRTNAGIDNISTYKKMYVFEDPGERAIVMLTAGSLSVTQTVMAKLRHRMEDPDASPDQCVMKAPSMLAAAEIVGKTLNEVSVSIGGLMGSMNQSASATILLAGQRRGGQMRLFLVYPEGNFIEATADTPFLQIGEHKYGKPILDRVVTPETTLEDGRKAALLSMDSTLRSNLSVGMPLDLAVIPRDQHLVGYCERIEPGDPNFSAMSDAWSEALKNSFVNLPEWRIQDEDQP